MKRGNNGLAAEGLTWIGGQSSPSPRAMRCSLLLILAVGVWAQAAASGRSVEEQLERMSIALRSLSYEGTLVYSHDGRLETLRIVHRIEDGRAHERLESLNGPLRTMTRERGQVTCRLSGDHRISVQPQGLGADLLRSRSIDITVLSPHYLVHPLGSARVAGRQTEVVGIIPRDSLRYGYRFYLDTESGLPLRSDLMGSEASPIEQLMFTSLTLDPVQLPAGTIAPEQGPERVPVSKELGPWRFGPLPPGFELVMVDRSPDAAGDLVEHFLLSDGLASVSVYVENGAEDGLTGGSRIGAIHAAGGKVAGHQITVVGEAPAGTVRAVLAAVVHTGGDGR